MVDVKKEKEKERKTREGEMKFPNDTLCEGFRSTQLHGSESRVLQESKQEQVEVHRLQRRTFFMNC